MVLPGDHRTLSDSLYWQWPQNWPWHAHWFPKLASDLPDHHEFSWKFELFVEPEPGLWVCPAHLAEVLWGCAVAGRALSQGCGSALGSQLPIPQWADGSHCTPASWCLFITQILSWMKYYIRKNYFWHSWLVGMKPQSKPLSSTGNLYYTKRSDRFPYFSPNHQACVTSHIFLVSKSIIFPLKPSHYKIHYFLPLLFYKWLQSQCFMGMWIQEESHGRCGNGLTGHGTVPQPLGEDTMTDPEVIVKLN